MKVASGLPPEWGAPPLAVYFHESQWTYPDPDLDRRPYLVTHLDALEAATAVWFNSRYHRRVFKHAATENPSRRVRRLAREVIARHWSKTRVLYPPVKVSQREPGTNRGRFTIAWAARWEREKRPDLFVAALEECLANGLDLELHLLGLPGGIEPILPELPPAVRRTVSPYSGFPGRERYEAALAASDLFVSTAEHEFFGVAALEAALLGAMPLLPRALAYPETLPSAPTYTPGDAAALAKAIMALSGRRFGVHTPWRYDAARFLAERSAARFDRLVDDLAGCR